MPLLNFGQPADGVVQLGFVVEDIHKAMRRYTDLLNAGPWTLFERMSLSNIEYRGKPTTLDLSIAIGCVGHMQIELIQQNDDQPFLYSEGPNGMQYGFHHWGLATQDFDRDIRRFQDLGYEIAAYAYVDEFDARGAYMDTTRDLPGMVELMEFTPPVEQMFLDAYKAALGWDGSDPIRIVSAETERA